MSHDFDAPLRSGDSRPGPSVDTVVERKPLAQLIPAEYNPRAITNDALAGLARSIDRFGLVELIVWNRRTQTVVSGHQRLKVLHARGESETDVVVVDLPPNEERALNIAMNNPAIAGEFTTDLQALLADLHAADEALFDDLMFEPLLVEAEPDTPKTDPDAIPAERPTPTARLGDLWVLGEHRVLCGDAGNPESFARLFGDERPTLLATDPPYGVNYAELTRSRGGGHVNADWRDIEGDDLSGDDLEKLLVTALASDGALAAFVWIPSTMKGPRIVFQESLPMAGWDIRQEIVWAKNHFNFGMADYHWQHETALYAKRKGAPRLRDRSQSTLWQVPREMGIKHPTQKPVELFARAIRNHTAPGEIVHDPFLGSGSCLIAAEQERRRCYGIELEPAYVDLQVARWEEFTGKKARCER